MPPSSLNRPLLTSIDIKLDVEIVKPPTRTGGSSWYAAAFVIANNILGAALLNFPSAYQQAGGILASTLVQAFVMVFVVASLILLAFGADLFHRTTYQQVVRSFCGHRAYRACILCIALYEFGSCVSCLVIIGDQWDKVFYFTNGARFCQSWYLNRKTITALTSLILILPFCFSRRIDFLKYVSVLGVAVTVYFVALVSVKYFIKEKAVPVVEQVLLAESLSTGSVPSTWIDLLLVAPVVCFAYECHTCVVQVYCCMAKRTLTEYSKAIGAALALCFCIYSFTASFGYLTFGAAVNTDILLSYQPAVEVLLAVALYALKMYATYPLYIFVLRQLIEQLWIDEITDSVDKQEHSGDSDIDTDTTGEKKGRRIIVTIVCFASSLIAAIFVPNIGIIVAALGILSATFIFIFPGLCLLQLYLGNLHYLRHSASYVWEESTLRRLLLASAILFLAVGSFFLGQMLAQWILDCIKLAKDSSSSSAEGCIKS